MTGTGTEADPYVITTLTDLQNMNNDLDAYYVLANDIDASGTAAWNGGEGFVPIGNSVTPFQGQFDGGGFTITGLTINRPTEDNLGLFGYVQVDDDYLSVDIRNLTLASVDITGDDNIGGLAGQLSDYSTDGAAIAITNCITSGAIVGDDLIGGFIGYGSPFNSTSSTITDCSSSCTVTGGATASDVGGFIGLAGYATMHACQASGAVSGQARVGGFAGSIGTSATVKECLATGAATASGTGVTGYGHAGGFVGRIWSATVEDCYARGAATDSGNASLGGSAGGFAGNVQSGSTLTRCYATGAPAGSTYQGGFVGYDQTGAYVTCAWDTTTSGEADACGSGAVSGVTGYTTAEMQDGTATTGWPAVEWGIIAASNNGYACLLGITSGCVAATTPNVIGDRTVVTERPVLELIRNVEVQLDGRFYVDKDGNAVYESRFHRSG